MPIDYDAAFEELYSALVEGLVNESTKTQMVLDAMITREEIRLSGAGKVVERIKAGDTVAWASAIEAFRKRALRLVDDMITAAGATGVEQRLDEQYGAEDLMRWVVTSGNPCPDCLGRSGQVHSYAYWQTAGTPKSGWSVCGSKCRCQLVPLNVESPETFTYTNRRTR